VRVRTATKIMMRESAMVVTSIFVKIVGRILRKIMISITVMVRWQVTPTGFAKSVLSEKRHAEVGLC
jgi:hypothetical protein